MPKARSSSKTAKRRFKAYSRPLIGPSRYPSTNGIGMGLITPVKLILRVFRISRARA